MNMKKEFEYAAIFSADDVKDDFIGCVASAMDEYDDVAILVEGQQGINRIAEVLSTYESEVSSPKLHLQIHESIAGRYGIDAEAVETLLNVAVIIKSNRTLSFKESLKIATAIAESYNISHK